MRVWKSGRLNIVTKSEETSSLAPETVSIQVVVLETASLIPLPLASLQRNQQHLQKVAGSITFLLELSETFTKENLD